MKAANTLLILLMAVNYLFAQPQHFTFTANTGDSYSIVVTNATIDEVSLASGDEIGVFTPAGLCVGASVWNGNVPLALIAWADDSQTGPVDGYAAGEQMSFKIWQQSSDKEFDAEVSYIQGNGTFGNGAFAQLSLVAVSGGVEPGGIKVTNTNDSGTGSLRAAIELANSNIGPDTINFAIPKGMPGHDAADGVWRIFPQGQLPVITDALLTINGFSQREFIGEDSNPLGPEIVINGENAGQYMSGLVVRASGVRIMGLTINNFYSNGIWLDYADGGGILGCYIGTAFNGSESAPNGYGVWIGNRSRYIAVAPIDTFRNVISGNTNGGIFVSDTSHHVNIIGNIIGLNSNGTAPLGNGNYGGVVIQRQCDSVAVFDNWIGGNKYGIYIYAASRNHIETNWIGKTPEQWEPGLGNEYDGIFISDKSYDNLILGNFIWFNQTAGVRIYGEQPFGNRISHNSICRNNYSGILYDSGGANVLPRPVITSATGNSVSGTAIPNASIEIYTDVENQGEIFQGETSSDASGNFTWSGVTVGPYANFTAIAIDPAGNTSPFSQPVSVTAVEETAGNQAPEQISLHQNYPNPFNPETVIRYELPARAHVQVRIINLLGEEVATLVDEEKAAGVYSLKWNGADSAGRRVASGVYLCQLQAGDLSTRSPKKSGQSFAAIKKMLLLR